MLEIIQQELEAAFYIVVGLAALFVGMAISDIADWLFKEFRDMWKSED